MGSSLVWLCLATLLLPWFAASAAQRTYIVHMNHHEKPASYPTHHDWYTAHLQSLPSATTQDSLLYTYTTAFHGFAASLDDAQAESLLRSDSVLALYEERVYTLHTTRTPEFLGIGAELGLWAVLNVKMRTWYQLQLVVDLQLLSPMIWVGKEINAEPYGPIFCLKSRVVRYTRELTNVGAAGSVYQVSVDAPPAVRVTVKPARIVFRNVGDKLRYTVTFVSNNGANQMTRSAFGSILWNNAEHQVRSPVAFAWTRL
ncbi:hypothetical protein RJ639_032491 [Escallonia herrerae]|uniref:Uncharacterized protein n=1 Tax=Escallonia herrerae TaxID=1293975 RepID=A0AA89BFC7_9ASTE|nr:hypothetical protein RJ639_032491 [Escallonia herrerae]